MRNSQFKAKDYRLTDNRSGESTMIKTGRNGKLTILDKEKGHRRAIRHCPNQRSIFIDEQDEFAKVEPIIFKGGYLHVKADQPMTQLFLDNHPTNIENNEGNGWFEVVDDELEAKEGIEYEELAMDVKTTIRAVSKEENGIHKLSAVAAVLIGSVDDATKMGIEELKRTLYIEVDKNINRFVDESGNVTIFDDHNIQRKYLILSAIKSGVLKKSANGKAIMWSNSGKVIATAPRSVDTIEYFADFLTSDEGILVAEEIVNQS